jgi:hypothetical protein
MSVLTVLSVKRERERKRAYSLHIYSSSPCLTTGHDWKMVFSQLGIYHMRNSFVERPQYRRWFYSFAVWAQNIQSRKFARADVVLWKEQIATIMATAEILYPLKWSTCATHYLIHIADDLLQLGIHVSSEQTVSLAVYLSVWLSVCLSVRLLIYLCTYILIYLYTYKFI